LFALFVIFQKIAYRIHQIYSRPFYTFAIRLAFESTLIGALHVPLQGMAPPAIPCNLLWFPGENDSRKKERPSANRLLRARLFISGLSIHSQKLAFLVQWNRIG